VVVQRREPDQKDHKKKRPDPAGTGPFLNQMNPFLKRAHVSRLK
jgi:hypothetical protein